MKTNTDYIIDTPIRYKTTLHRDRTVTYWSVYNQVWCRTMRPPDRELAAMSEKVRARVKRHLGLD